MIAVATRNPDTGINMTEPSITATREIRRTQEPFVGCNEAGSRAGESSARTNTIAETRIIAIATARGKAAESTSP